MSRLVISAPSDRNARTVQVIESGQNAVFSFSFDGTTVAREGTDLLISFGNGSELLLEGFFVAQKNGALPVMELSDGTRVDAADFLSNLNPALDVTTATGPSAISVTSSGSGEYSDTAGSLIDGVDRLGSLGTTRWGLERELASISTEGEVRRLVAAPGDEPTDFEPDPEDRPVTPEPVVSYDARALLYVDGENYTVDTAVVYAQVLFPDAGGNPMPMDPAPGKDAVKITPTAGWNSAWGVAEYDAATGRIAFILTPAGHAALGAEGGKLLEYFDVTVKNGNDAFTYTMQVVVASDREFSSSAQNAQDKADGIFSRDEILYGEWHNGYAGSNDDGKYTIYSSTGNDSIHIAENIRNGSRINSGAGADSITIDGMLSAQNEGSRNIVDGGDGNDAVTITDWLMATDKGENHVIGGAGIDTILVEGFVMALGEGSKNIIDLGSGEAADGNGMGDMEVLRISSNWVAASEKGMNEIKGGANRDSITLEGDLIASQGGANFINGGGGDDEITIGGDVQATTSGVNIITGGSGCNTITIDGLLHSGPGGANHVLSEGGEIQLSGLSVFGEGATLAANNTIWATSDAGVAIVIHATMDGSIADPLREYAHALFTTGKNAVNTILGGRGADSISLTGDIDTWDYHAAGTRNSVTTHGRNIIDAGGGADTIELDGRVGGSFHINGGDGEDTLILRASTIDEFIERYGTWLQSDELKFNPAHGDNAVISITSIETVIFHGFTTEDIAGNQTLKAIYDKFDTAGCTIEFGDAAAIANGNVEALDHVDYQAAFTDPADLTLDTLLDGFNPDARLAIEKISDLDSEVLDVLALSESSVVRINTDAGDMVNVNTNLYSAAGTVEYDTMTYDIYRAESGNESVLLLIQQYVG